MLGTSFLKMFYFQLKCITPCMRTFRHEVVYIYNIYIHMHDLQFFISYSLRSTMSFWWIQCTYLSYLDCTFYFIAVVILELHGVTHTHDGNENNHCRLWTCLLVLGAMSVCLHWHARHTVCTHTYSVAGHWEECLFGKWAWWQGNLVRNRAAVKGWSTWWVICDSWHFKLKV